MTWRAWSRAVVGAAAGLWPLWAPHAALASTTFTAHVAPILYQHCAPCHRPGGSSSTVLLTYDQARAHARQIVELTASRRMPPWQPEGEPHQFQGDRRLSSTDIEVFRNWLREGVPMGDPRLLPPMPAFPTGWLLGTPDLVLTMPAYSLRADGPDTFRNFVLPVPTDRMRYVRAWEFRPGNARVVHHATMQVDTSGASSRYDASDQAVGYEGLIAPSARAPDGFFLDWAPGHRPNIAVPGTAWPLPPSSDLVMMLHLRPSGKPEQVQASVALYFAEVPPAHLPVMLRLTRQDLDIAPGAAEYTVTDRLVLPVDVDAYTVQPHAHYLARTIEGKATRPDGSRVPLVSIPDWDFNWQDVYHYERPPRLPAGSTIEMRITYDNTASNPRNPNSPPAHVGYGQQTSDEMAEMWFQVVPVRDEERQRLVDALYRKVLPEEIKGREAMLRREPENVALHDDVALMRAELGDLAGAERAFRESLTLRPQSVSARFNVGLALLGQGRLAEAQEYFTAAVAADPNYGPAHFQLGLLAQARGDLAGASGHLEVALSARPADADVLLAAGVLDAMQGRDTRAVARMRGALDVRPGFANAEAALASVLSTGRQADAATRREAVAFAERAVARTGRKNAAFLDILAGAYAASGETRRAVAVAREALALAEGARDSGLATSLRARIAAWEDRR